MHESSYLQMQILLPKYLDPTQTLRILDVGSYNLNGCYRPLVSSPYWHYTGMDIEAGPNVDVVSQDPYSWPLPANSYDVVISGQCIEHVEAPWLWIKEIELVLKPGGTTIVIGPWSCGEHRHPVDCWRIFPDGMKYLLTKVASLELLECARNEKGIYDLGDTWGVAKKPVNT